MIFHEAVGDGPVVVLLHEAVADSRMWEPQVAALADSRRVITVDFRGYGRSPLEPGPFAHYRDVLEVLDALGIERVAAVGGSMGASVALQVALARPELVTGLALIAPGLGGHEWSQQVRDAWAAEEAAYEAGDLDQAVEVNLRTWVDGPSRRPEEVDPQVRELVGRMQRRAFELYREDAGPEEVLEPPAYDRLAEVSCPTLVIVGDLDQPDIVAIASRVAAEVPDATLETVPGTAHVPSLERPDVVNRLLVDFLASIPSPRA